MKSEIKAWLYINKETREERVSQVRWRQQSEDGKKVKWVKNWDEKPLSVQTLESDED